VALSNSVKADDRADGEEVFSETQRAAAVVLDVNTFDVLALASYPDFEPQLFVAGIDEDTFQQLNETKAFNNLAVSGLYPPASTFKAITYTAKLEENLPFPPDGEGVDGELIHCDGTLEGLGQLADGSPGVKRDWYNPRNLGWLDIHGALENSCNIYFWNVALGTHLAYQGTAQENILQDWATRVGYGAETGIDLSSEASGTVPTRELFEEWKESQLENPDQPPRLEPDRLELASPWLGGDLMDFAIGQGAFTSTPLQVAVSYAVLVNGGRLMEPRVVREIIDAEGNVTPVDRPEAVTVDIDPATRASLLTDLGRVVNGGTAAAAFSGFGEGVENVGGKTGTAQVSAARDNHAWFVGVAPLDNPRYVVAVLIDEGGSGGQVAAPVARHIMQYLMGNEPTPIVEGEEAD
jgi:penicillin-binding protein 2